MSEFESVQKSVNGKKEDGYANQQNQPQANINGILQMARNKPGLLSVQDIAQLQRTIGNRAVSQMLANQPDQGFEVIPRAEKVPQEVEGQEQLQMKNENRTGMPDNLKAGIEHLSGFDMSGVRVHYNSDKPAQLGALAYTQGMDIHVGPGQEQHLSHEAWHVVQQTQGRVKPMMQMRGLTLNDNARLEREADELGAKASHEIPSFDKIDSINNGAGLNFNSMGSDRVSSQPIQCITPEELMRGRANLKRADYGVLDPELRGIRARRGAGQTAADYYEHMLDTRSSIQRLKSRPTGKRMLQELNGRTGVVNPGAVGDERNHPLTVVDIESGRGLGGDDAMKHSPRHNGTYGDVQRGYRYNGNPGAGLGSKVTYDETRPSANRFVSLGHELVHAWRTANGVAVSPPQVSPRRNAPILNTTTDTGQRIVEDAVNLHAHQREEFETVGLQDTPGVPWAPTENMIRGEHARMARNDYSGVVPGGLENTVNQLDEATDDRGPLDKLFKKQPPHYVRGMINYLEN